MSTRTFKVTFEDGTTDVLLVPPGAPGDNEWNFSFRGSGFSRTGTWSEARAEAIARVESDSGKKVASLEE